MTEEEALLAVEPPLKVTNDESTDEADENDDGRNPFKLKKCTIPIQKVSYIERAVKEGCWTILVTRDSKRRQYVRLIYD